MMVEMDGWMDGSVKHLTMLLHNEQRGGGDTSLFIYFHRKAKKLIMQANN